MTVPDLTILRNRVSEAGAVVARIEAELMAAEEVLDAARRDLNLAELEVLDACEARVLYDPELEVGVSALRHPDEQIAHRVQSFVGLSRLVASLRAGGTPSNYVQWRSRDTVDEARHRLRVRALYVGCGGALLRPGTEAELTVAKVCGACKPDVPRLVRGAPTPPAPARRVLRACVASPGLIGRLSSRTVGSVDGAHARVTSGPADWLVRNGLASRPDPDHVKLTELGTTVAVRLVELGLAG